uniref:Uncharacterized protein n=1 Tax=Arundo donax TaxID=35708 RepID=A0A0A9FMH1_ARUDO
MLYQEKEGLVNRILQSSKKKDGVYVPFLDCCPEY